MKIEKCYFMDYTGVKLMIPPQLQLLWSFTAAVILVFLFYTSLVWSLGIRVGFPKLTNGFSMQFEKHTKNQRNTYNICIKPTISFPDAVYVYSICIYERLNVVFGKYGLQFHSC